MARHKKAYELGESQVITPPAVVSLFWKLIHKRRARFGTVLDMGAGDCRFAIGGCFDRYVGVEIDKSRAQALVVPQNGRFICNCVFRHRKLGYDACIGNPPYVRHHDIESPWKEKTAVGLERQLGINFNRHSNLYLYFLSLGLVKTHDKGLVALIIPYEWVSRPSGKAIRAYIRRQRWDVEVYRFSMPIFDGVLTTASVSIVDKSKCSGRWSFHDISPDYQVHPRPGVVNSRRGVLQYMERGKVWAMRGLSPGSQQVFALTEGERNHHGLGIHDVIPCVTTLRNVPRALRQLNRASFRKHFVEAGRRCWLIKSFKTTRSMALNAYLDAVPKAKRDTYTCRHQEPWFNYLPHPVPKLLVSSGFTNFGPKVLLNSLGACAVGSVLGIHAKQKPPLRGLQQSLLGIDFEKQVVAHAKTLKKIEVKQLNGVLSAFASKKLSHGSQRV